MPRGPTPSHRARRLVLLLVIGVVLVGLLVRTGLPPLWAFPVHRAISASMAEQKIPGLSVAVVADGKLRWSAGFGLADLENHVPARASTVYRWASVSKPVTAVAVMQLAEQGRLDLDAPIQAYVPTFPAKPWPITPRQLLGHLGGIRHYQGDEIYSTRHYDRFADAFPVFQDDPLVAEPGTKFSYTTYGYNLLGAAVEKASGKPFLDALRDRVFQPAGMTHAGAARSDALITHRARGYAKDPAGAIVLSRAVDLSNKTPGGGLCGTAEDAARFAAALQAHRLLRAESFAAMKTRQTTRDGTPVDYGLGWNLSKHNGRDEVWHGGAQPEVTTLLYMIPARRFAVTLMANLEGAQLMDLARSIAASVLGERD